MTHPKQRKIGYLVPEFPGQTHNFFWREINALRELGIEVMLISTRRPPAGLGSPSWAQEATNRTLYLYPMRVYQVLIAVINVVLWGARGGVPQLLSAIFSNESSMRRVLRLAAFSILGEHVGRVCKGIGVRHIHVHSCGDSANIALFANIIHGVTYSLTLHNPVSIYGGNQSQKWKRAKFGIVITQKILVDLKSRVDGCLPECVLVAPMGVDVDVFRRRQEYFPHKRGEVLRLICCARLNPAKGHFDLVRAVAHLVAAGTDVELEIVGEDDVGGAGFRLEIERSIASLGLSRQVRMFGAVSEQIVRERLEQSHIFVLASIEEPLGVALMEAMAMEIPVVATRAGGVPELVVDGACGLLVEPRNPEAIYAAIARISGDANLAERLGIEGRRRVVESFSHRISATGIAGMI